VRLSGTALGSVACSLIGTLPQPRVATLARFLDAAGAEIDVGIALYFPAPHSYTGEDVLELQGHGGPMVMQLLLRRCLDLGARLAEPGEFTRRAFLNDKLDLAQVEAVADLIEATTSAAARSAVRSLSGEFSRLIHELVDRLVGLRMLVEATLDFPEEEIDFLQRADALGQLARIRTALADVLARAHQGALLRAGMNVVLAGRPNVGKSSLLNALAGAEVAIVTPVAGTTRDKVTQAIQIDGVPVNIIDTAGLRETGDEVERIGIARTWEEVAKADVILHLQTAGHVDALDADIAARLPANVPIVRVVNKIDLAGEGARIERAEGVPSAPVRAVHLSAKTGEGIDLLRGALLELAGWQGASESQFIARERHLQALQAAAAHLASAQANAERQAQALDLFAEELRLAQERLNEITGAFTADYLLGVIFSRFCIGK